MSSNNGGITTLLYYFTFTLIFIEELTTLVSAGVGSSSVSQNDNINPANANPRYNITCLGEYDRALPLDAGFSPVYPSEISMQKLCAKTQFNGGPPGQHIGGWCQRSHHHSEVVFDLGIGAQINPVVANPRVMLACSYRCFCNYGITFHDFQPRYGDYAEQWESDETYEVAADVVDDYDVTWTQNFEELPSNSLVEVPKISHVGTAGKKLVTVAEVLTESQQAYELDPTGSEPHKTYVSMDSDNSIECHGRLPQFPLPLPYRASDFATLQQLCAVQFFDGLREANAGGYCHRSTLPDGSLRRTVWFSDEFTPRHEWTWGGNNFYASAAIRFHCWQRCYCDVDQSKKDPTTVMFNNPVWNIIASQNIAKHNDGSLTLEDSGSKQDEVQILPPQPPINRLSHYPPAGTCGRDGKQFCPATWPTEILGPVSEMQNPPNATLVVKDPTNHNFTKCGMYCDTSQDCAPSDSKDACVCALPSNSDVRKLSLDPISPRTICLVLALAVTTISGRDVPQFLDDEGYPYQCACNSTFISNECCGSNDGMVWLS